MPARPTAAYFIGIDIIMCGDPRGTPRRAPTARPAGPTATSGASCHRDSLSARTCRASVRLHDRRRWRSRTSTATRCYPSRAPGDHLACAHLCCNPLGRRCDCLADAREHVGDGAPRDCEAEEALASHGRPACTREPVIAANVQAFVEGRGIGQREGAILALR